MHTGEQIVRNLRKASASAYLVKSEASPKLVETVERLLAGERFFASENAVHGSNREGSAPAQYLLSPRELDVLRLLAKGRSNKEIAFELNVSVRTVEGHRARILAKLEAESTGDLVRIAVRDGLV